MSDAIRDAVLKGLQFIEDNLLREIGVGDVAKAAAYSQFYFSREFSRLTHMTVYDYILRRKLSESYRELLNRRIKIVDLAYRYGFQSHEVFTRAFRKLFGENPSDAASHRPSRLFAPIDERYLDFLSGLRVERMEHIVRNRRFEITGTAPDFRAEGEKDFLVLFAPENKPQVQDVFAGTLRENEGSLLSFRFHSLRHGLRIHRCNPVLAFRYYGDNIDEGSAISGNYLLLKSAETHIDFSFRTDIRSDTGIRTSNLSKRSGTCAFQDPMPAHPW